MNTGYSKTVPSGSRLRNGLTPNPRGVSAKSKKSRAKYPCGRIWPNGEFGISWRVKDEELEPLAVNPAGGSSLDHQRLMCLIVRLEEEYLKAVSRVCLYPWLVKSSKSAHRPETYGRKGVTPYGSKVVRNGAHLLQEKYGRGRLAFLTLTLPEYSHSELCHLAANWGYLIKTLLQGLRRLLRRAQLPESIVLVTELQPNRLEAGSMGALHLHLVFVGRHRRRSWAYSPFVYKALWLRLLSNKLGRAVECVPCENVEPVKKDASNYLSKYMSKGAGDIARYAEIEGWGKVPRQWWSATTSVKKAVAKRTLSGSVTMGLLDEILWNYWQSGGKPLTRGVVFSRPITIAATDYQDYVIGYFGKVTQETYADLYEISVSYRDSLDSVC